MAKKRTHAVIGIRAGSRSDAQGDGRKRRKAAETSDAKIKQLADDEDHSDEDDPDAEEVEDVPIAARPPVRGPAALSVEEMPLVAPGLRLWEGFAEKFAGTELASLAKFDDETKLDKKALDVQRKYGTSLKPLMVTEGPLAGRKVLVLDETTGFRFLDLPPEIRNIVYGYLFGESGEVGIRSYKPNGQPRRSVRQGFFPGTYGSLPGLTWDRTRGRWLGREWSAHALLAVSKQVLGETAPLVYGGNTFAPFNFSDTPLFLEGLGSMRRYLRQVKIPAGAYYPTHARSTFELLKDAVDLRTLLVSHTMACPTYRVWRGKMDPTRLGEFTKPLLKHLQKVKAAQGVDLDHSVLDIVKLDTARDEYWPCWSCRREPRSRARGSGTARRHARSVVTTSLMFRRSYVTRLRRPWASRSKGLPNGVIAMKERSASANGEGDGAAMSTYRVESTYDSKGSALMPWGSDCLANSYMPRRQRQAAEGGRGSHVDHKEHRHPSPTT